MTRLECFLFVLLSFAVMFSVHPQRWIFTLLIAVSVAIMACLALMGLLPR